MPSPINRLKWLQDPLLNKGTAFTREEREVLGLRGLLPPRIRSQDEQVMRVMINFRKKSNDLERYLQLASLQDRNETLFYRVVMDRLDEMMPIIYTPTVGKACQEFGFLLRRPRGIYVTADDKGQVARVLRNWPEKNVRVIVVTDGERILGLGDLGTFGMGIPVGKLALYTACAGIHPQLCLPVTLDVGTDNELLLNEPRYTGLKQRRLRGPLYDQLVDEFVMAVQKVFPKALIQFEDFANRNAFRLLKKYQQRACTFNDDIQGTASVALAGIYSASRITRSLLKDQTILFFGAGEAGIGIADLVVAALADQGMPFKEARRRCWFVDSKGLVVKNRLNLAEHKLPYAHDFIRSPAKPTSRSSRGNEALTSSSPLNPEPRALKPEPCPDLLSAIECLRPTILIGASGMPGSFTRPVLEAMGKLNKRPVIFALSNPTSKAECTAEQAYRWSQGRAVFASGSPFPPVTLNGCTFMPGQANNAYIFPGVGLGVVASEAKHVTESMFYSAAKALADQVLEADLAQGRIYPSLNRMREVSAAIAAAVAEEAWRRKLARRPKPRNLARYLESQMYVPDYVSYV